jgi:F0F1-type ATP synthase assembly protein I
VAAKDNLVAGARYAAFGTELALTVGAGVYLGYQADQYFGTEPWCMLLLSLGGLYAAVRRLLWSLNRNR